MAFAKAIGFFVGVLFLFAGVGLVIIGVSMLWDPFGTYGRGGVDTGIIGFGTLMSGLGAAIPGLILTLALRKTVTRRQMAALPLMTALVAAGSWATIPLPGRQVIHFGHATIFLAALLSGPLPASIAAAAGTLLTLVLSASFLLQPVYVGVLLAVALEGGTIGWLWQRSKPRGQVEDARAILRAVVACAIGGVLGTVLLFVALTLVGGVTVGNAVSTAPGEFAGVAIGIIVAVPASRLLREIAARRA